jgi:hypothetical protein
LILALASLAAAQLEYKEEVRKIRISEVPKVQIDGDCRNLCIFYDKTNHWCFESTPPMLQMGWKWTQTFAQSADTVPVKYYTLKLQPYVITQAYVKMEFQLTALYYNLLILDISKFLVDLFALATINANGFFCYGAGYDNDEIKMQVLMSQRFTDCSKTLLQELCDISNSWAGYDAKWLENCGQGTDAEIKLYKYSLMKAAQNNVWVGTANPKSAVYCYNLLGKNNIFVKLFGGATTTTTKAEVMPETGDVITQTLFSNLFDYFEAVIDDK